GPGRAFGDRPSLWQPGVHLPARSVPASWSASLPHLTERREEPRVVCAGQARRGRAPSARGVERILGAGLGDGRREPRAVASQDEGQKAECYTEARRWLNCDSTNGRCGRDGFPKKRRGGGKSGCSRPTKCWTTRICWTPFTKPRGVDGR